jgi:hypothetical protein
MQEEAEAEWGGKNWPPLSQLALRMRLAKVCFLFRVFHPRPPFLLLYFNIFSPGDLSRDEET